MTYLIVGLGNPGDEYEATRHNVGAMAVTALATDMGGEKVKDKVLADLWQARVHDDVVYFMFPRTYMNLSGDAVAPFMKRKRISAKNLVLVHDELDIPFGTIRVSTAISSAGHNGVQSVIDALKTNGFSRVRIGIGPRTPNIPGDKFVLGRFSKEETDALPAVIEDSHHAVKEIIFKSKAV